MKIAHSLFLAAFALADGLAGVAMAQTVTDRVPMTVSDGHETDPRDHGRPVVLVAAALGVAPEVFRDAFSRVKPAPAGQVPEPGQVRLNQQALMSSLWPYGITNERLDEVSNYYRYRREDGGLWRHSPAKIVASMDNGVVTGFTILDPGSGYTVAPTVVIPGMPQIKVTVTLSFGTNFDRNGSIKGIKLRNDSTTTGQQ